MTQTSPDLSRRSFLQSACLSGLCACGTANLALGADPEPSAPQPAVPAATPDPMPLKWIAALLPQLADQAGRSEAKSILKGCSEAHYAYLEMDRVVTPFKGKLDDFLAHLTKSWGWKINYDQAAKVIVIDEAKNKCVCPLVQDPTKPGLSILCDCSEGFAERMFSAVVGRRVEARVTASILRGAKSCQYRIKL